MVLRHFSHCYTSFSLYLKKDTSYAQFPSAIQEYWILRKTNKGQLWKDMARDFNEEFKSTRTDEELQLGYTGF